MNTNELIDMLASHAPAVDRRVVARRFTLAIAVGLLLGLLGLLVFLGIRPDLAEVARTPLFWLKLAFPASLLGGSLWMTARQIEAARVAMTRYVRRGGKVWLKVFPHKPITKKAAETRMGSGKGVPEYWVDVIKPGRILYELSGVPEDIAREAMRLAAHKLPFKTRFVTRMS